VAGKSCPAAHELQDGGRGNNRSGQRQHDAAEDAHEASAVDDGRLLELARQLTEEAREQQDVNDVRAAALRQDHPFSRSRVSAKDVAEHAGGDQDDAHRAHRDNGGIEEVQADARLRPCARKVLQVERAGRQAGATEDFLVGFHGRRDNPQ
jgi:hypothetical protein